MRVGCTFPVSGDESVRVFYVIYYNNQRFHSVLCHQNAPDLLAFEPPRPFDVQARPSKILGASQNGGRQSGVDESRRVDSGSLGIARCPVFRMILHEDN